MCDFGTGNNNKLNWVLEDKQELIDIIETIYKGAKKGRGLVVSPKGEPMRTNRVRRAILMWAVGRLFDQIPLLDGHHRMLHGRHLLAFLLLRISQTSGPKTAAKT